MTTTVRQPKVNVNIVNANVAVENTEQKILFVGQKTSAGTATALALNESIPNDGSEDTLFGRDSMLATMMIATTITTPRRIRMFFFFCICPPFNRQE